MYSIVMVAAMTAAPERRTSSAVASRPYRVAAAAAAYGSSCYGCCGGWSCCGFCGSSYSCYGCCGGGCCGGCYGCHGYVSVYSCCGGCCGGCYGCYGGYAFGGCCGGYAMPATPGEYVVPGGPVPAEPIGPAKEMKDNKGGKKTGPTASGMPIAVNTLPSNRGQVVVYAPANAKLFADGQATTLSGTERVFQTPELVAGRDFQYTLKIEYTQGTEIKSVSKQVLVRAGHRTVVDFATPTDTVTSAVTVNLPAKAKLYVDGVATPASGGKQSFRTPELTRGKSYVYEFRAEVDREGKTDIESRKVTFKAGDPIVVDFNEPAAVRTASR